MVWIDVPDPRDPGRKLMRYDPARRMIEIQHRKQRTWIDLDHFHVVADGGTINWRPQSS